MVQPYTAADAKGLLKSAIRDPNPVIVLENEILYGRSFEVPELDDFTVPIGKARIAREGTDVTIVSFGIGMTYALQAAEELAKEGISAEVIDLRSLRPMDTDAVIASVKKTNRCVTVEEGFPVCSIGNHISAVLMEKAFDYLDAPVLNCTGKDVPMPYAANLEKLALVTTAGGDRRRARPSPTAEERAMPINILMPALSPTMEEGTLAKWLVKEGDKVTSGAVIAEIETDKATMEFEAVDEGVRRQDRGARGHRGREGQRPDRRPARGGRERRRHRRRAGRAEGDAGRAPRPTGARRAGRTGGRSRAGRAAPAAPTATASSPRRSRGGSRRRRGSTSPRSRAPARTAASSRPTSRRAKPGAAPQPPPAPRQPARRGRAAAAGRPDAEAVKKLYADREFEEVKLDGMRKTIAARLTEAKQTIPHFYLRRDIRLDALLAFRGAAQQGARGARREALGQRLHHQGLRRWRCSRCPTATPSGPATGCCG